MSKVLKYHDSSNNWIRSRIATRHWTAWPETKWTQLSLTNDQFFPWHLPRIGQFLIPHAQLFQNGSAKQAKMKWHVPGYDCDGLFFKHKLLNHRHTICSAIAIALVTATFLSSLLAINFLTDANSASIACTWIRVLFLNSNASPISSRIFCIF